VLDPLDQPCVQERRDSRAVGELDALEVERPCSGPAAGDDIAGFEMEPAARA
jgi:hypothetical protein